MSLLFQYQLGPVPQPLVPLNRRCVRPRPLIPVFLTGPTGRYAKDCMLDTGADDSLFPDAVATKLGIDLATAPVGSGVGVGSASLTLRYGEVAFRVATGGEQREWQGWVGFTATKLRFPLLGFAGFLQYFDATFRGGLEQIELTVNSLYPGT